MVEDIDSWDYFLSFIPQQEQIGEEEKQELLRNWGHLRKVFGEDWFKKEENRIHPLRFIFHNHAPWCLRTISELGIGIESLKKKENFGEILKRIITMNTYEGFEGAYHEFWVGYDLFKLGVPFEYLKQHKKQKTSDIIVNVGERKIFLEVTKKNNPDDPLNSYQNSQKISWFLWSKGALADDFVFYFTILKPLSTPRAEQILHICEEMLEKAKKSGFEEHHMSNVIDMYITKKENSDKVPKEKRIMQWKTPDFNELNRIKGTIKEKAAQLETGNPAILIIFDAHLWIQYSTDPLYSNLEEDLREYVNQYTNLSAVVIEIEMTSGHEEPFIKEDERYIVVKGCDKDLLRSKNKIIILNEFADYPLSSEEKELLKKM
ncbi:Uncharacterised protein [uncultured archaeon]|nr:Uncharacterised protein [uncultured archaeon]